jgi:LPXTG-site transpeptidase (sortase) family protein
MRNQILKTNNKPNRKNGIFKWQFFMSILGILATIVFFKTSQNTNLSYENYSKTLSQSSILSSVYQTNKVSTSSNIFGKLEIPSLNMSYAIFNEFSEELLNISPCKFYGVNINETGNIAIAGHNFDNHTFFSDLNKLKNDDEIYLYSNSNEKYTYRVYSTFETTSTDLDVLNTNFINSKELTLVTCNNSNKKRFIVKAVLKP